MSHIKILWTPFALSCVDEIFDYVAGEAKSLRPAKKVTDRILKRTDQLKRFPESGQKETILLKIGQNSRYLVEGNYKIIYEYHDDENIVVITDVFHVKQNPDKLIKEQ